MNLAGIFQFGLYTHPVMQYRDWTDIVGCRIFPSTRAAHIRDPGFRVVLVFHHEARAMAGDR